MPVRLTRRHPFIRPKLKAKHLSNNANVVAHSFATGSTETSLAAALGKSYPLQCKLRRMPRVESAALTGVHTFHRHKVCTKENSCADNLNYYASACENLKRLSVSTIGEPTLPQPRPNHATQLAPLKKKSSSNSKPAASSLKEQLAKTREAYKEKLTLVKARLRNRRRRFQRSHLHYTAAKSSPNTVKAMAAMAFPPPREPLYFESSDSDDEICSNFIEKSNKPSRAKKNILLPKKSQSSKQLPKDAAVCNLETNGPVLHRSTTAPSSLGRRRGITPPPLDSGTYPFGEHSNDIARKP